MLQEIGENYLLYTGSNDVGVSTSSLVHCRLLLEGTKVKMCCVPTHYQETEKQVRDHLSVNQFSVALGSLQMSPTKAVQQQGSLGQVRIHAGPPITSSYWREHYEPLIFCF